MWGEKKNNRQLIKLKKKICGRGLDKTMLDGMEAFFNNRFEEAESSFKSKADE